MNIFGRIKSILEERIFDDEFYQPITEHEIYAVLNKKGPQRTSNGKLKLPHSSSIQQGDALAISSALSQHTPEMEFRMLGYEPSIETISQKMSALKAKLEVVDAYLL